MIIYLYLEHGGHEGLAIDLEELDKQLAPRTADQGIWNLLETIRDLGDPDDQT